MDQSKLMQSLFPPLYKSIKGVANLTPFQVLGTITEIQGSGYGVQIFCGLNNEHQIHAAKFHGGDPDLGIGESCTITVYPYMKEDGETWCVCYTQTPTPRYSKSSSPMPCSMMPPNTFPNTGRAIC